MPKVTMILPCLNMISYIEQCLDSVINQTLQDIEILVIDAGSTDGTCKILHTYAQKDVRVKIISSWKKSYGYQLNLGIATAKGEYIGIVDTDDRIAPDMCEMLYNIASSTGVDYVKGTARGFFTISDKLTYYYDILQFREEEYRQGKLEVVPKDMPELLTKDNFLWYGIYRKDFLKKIRLHESPGAAFQDLGGLLQTQMNAEKAIYISKAFYEYRQDNVNASGFNKKGFRFIVDEYTFAASFLSGKSIEWHKSFYRKLFLHAMSRFQAMAASGEFWEDTESDMLEIADRVKGALEKKFISREDFLTEDWKSLQLLLDTPKRLYENCFRAFSDKKNMLQQIFEWVKNRKVIVFGCGKLGTFLHVQMLSHELDNVVAYCDNNAQKHETLLYGVPVMSPRKAIETYRKESFIIANERHAEEMKKQLMSFGIGEANIMSYTVGTDIRLFLDT